MKGKFIAIISIAIILLVAGAWCLLPEKNNRASAPDLKNCSYSIEGSQVKLADGYSEEEAAPGSLSKIVTRYFGNEAEGDFNNDGIDDAAGLITQEAGGSGTFYYVVAALGGKGACQGTNGVFIGDRISPQSAVFYEGKIVVNYADRGEGEPMTAVPSVGKTKYFKVEGLNLVEQQ